MSSEVFEKVAQVHRLEDIQVGDHVCFEVTVTEALLQDFARISGDYNPLHMDEAYARKTQFGGRIVHGMLIASFFSQLVGMYLPGRHALYLSQSLRFFKPVRLDETLEISGKVTQKSETAQTLTLQTVASRKGKIVLEGEAQVMVMETSTLELPDIKPVILDLNGHVALVTGASRGIGAAIALLLAQHGAAVAVNYRSSQSQAEQIVSKLREVGKTALAFKADVADPDQVREMVEQIRVQLGEVSILVNNASGDALPKPFVETTWKEFQQNLDVTVAGTYHIIQAILSGMLARKHGIIINIGSAYTIGTPPDKLSRYIVAKYALVGLTKALATELGPQGIRVNMVAPGLTDTSLTAHLPHRIKDLAAFQSPLRRNATTEDTARAVLFLASEMAGFINGAILPVTGGSSMF